MSKAEDLATALERDKWNITGVTAQDAADELRRLEGIAERLKQEAQIHAQEARTANATIAEIYQCVTGSTGEPGNWNGANPVRDRIAALEALAAPQPDSTAIHSCSYYCDRPDCVKAQRDELREALANPAVPPGYALVPVAALKWLHGEEGEFDCPPEGYFRGKPAPYWWRKVFHKMCASAPQPKDKP